MGGAWSGMELFVRACTRAGLFGFLIAFILGFMVYGAALTAATVLLKWLVIGRLPAGVHKCAAQLLPCMHACCTEVKVPEETLC
jgi:hypothetical protein